MARYGSLTTLRDPPPDQITSPLVCKSTSLRQQTLQATALRPSEPRLGDKSQDEAVVRSGWPRDRGYRSLRPGRGGRRHRRGRRPGGQRNSGGGRSGVCRQCLPAAGCDYLGTFPAGRVRRSTPHPHSHVSVLFGATGDLTRRKLLGAFHLATTGAPHPGAIPAAAARGRGLARLLPCRRLPPYGVLGVRGVMGNFAL
jgi:hypothetical protein